MFVLTHMQRSGRDLPHVDLSCRCFYQLFCAANRLNVCSVLNCGPWGTMFNFPHVWEWWWRTWIVSKLRLLWGQSFNKNIQGSVQKLQPSAAIWIMVVYVKLLQSRIMKTMRQCERNVLLRWTYWGLSPESTATSSLWSFKVNFGSFSHLLVTVLFEDT